MHFVVIGALIIHLDVEIKYIVMCNEQTVVIIIRIRAEKSQ